MEVQAPTRSDSEQPIVPQAHTMLFQMSLSTLKADLLITEDGSTKDDTDTNSKGYLTNFLNFLQCYEAYGI